MTKKLSHLCLAAIIFTFLPGFGQQTKQDPSKRGQAGQVDTRVDNMRYWMKKAEAGLTPYNPYIPLVPAIFKGSQIRANGVRTTNSTDIPVTNLTDVTESENSVFVDPNNNNYLLNSNNSTSWTGSTVGSLYGANYFQSSNAGIGWVGSPNGAGGANSGDPTTAISLTGRQYVNFIDNPGGQGIAFSDDGTTWTTATITTNPGDLADKNHMWIDNKSTSPYAGNLYTAWTDFGGTDDTHIKISRSINNGVTWSSPVKLSAAILAGSHNQGVNIQTGPNGEVYAAWAVYDGWPTDESAIGFAKSTNGGVSYQAGTRVISNIRGIRTTTVSKNHRVNSFPVMAVDISGGPNNGNIYIVWTNVGAPGINTGTNKSVYIIRSTDGGTTWSTPVRVNQGPNADGKESYFPWISCDPVTGVLSVVFYDDRNVSSTQCEVFAAYSTDAGNIWTDFQVSDVAFTPAAIPGLAGGYMGDYLGITSKGGKVYPCWTDNRGGVYMTYVSPFELGLNAGFIANTTTICTGSGVTFTDVSTGPPTSWTWNFPGGTPSGYIGKIPPVITYSSPGTYNVSLTVSDGVTTDTETKTGYITVKNVIANFTGVPTTVATGNSVTFTDNSSCSPSTWDWSFPGGTPSSYSGQNPPAIAYSTLGSYDVSLTVTKPGGTDTRNSTGYITVAPPVFNITNGNVTTCTGDFYDTGGSSGIYQNNETFVETFYPSTPGSMIRFNFTSFSTELNYDTLTIYNGTNSSAPVIGKYHGTAGPGIVTASNFSGALTFRFHSDAAVTGTGWAASISCYSTTVPPVADFSASTTSPSLLQQVIFTDLSVNVPTSWSWVFSPATVTYVGGTTSSSQNPQVQFSAIGQYTVTLTATNPYGFDSEIKTNYISVENCTFNVLPFTESFTGTTIPNCWTQVDHQGNGQTWKFGTITGESPNPALNGNYAYLNSDGYGSGNSQNADLVTPTLDLSMYANITLQFNHYFKSYSGSSGTLSYSIDNGSTWVPVATFTATSASNPVAFSQMISAAAGQPAVRFKWNYTGTWGYYWGIDDVSVTGSSVSMPSVTTTTPGSITQTTASSGGNVVSAGTFPVTERGVCWGTAVNPPISGNHTTDGGGTGLFTSAITGLIPATLYHVRAYATNSSGTSYGENLLFTTACGGISAFPWTDGFEHGGLIPDCWTQVQINNSGVNWTFVYGNGDLNPSAPHNGSYNACLKDGSRADNKTQLITPELNLASLPSPQLKFWHTQTYWSPDQDALSVYYKTAPGAPWILLTTYANNIPAWTQETIALPNASGTYYIAFEGNAKYGYGVCVDDVEVSSSCAAILPVGLSIAVSQNPVCSGTSVTFTSTAVNGGATPAYEWKVNGLNTGTNMPSFTYLPAGGDAVTCRLTSSETCVSGNPSTSNVISMNINPVLPVSVAITPSANPTDSGNLVTFTATAINAGTNPYYQWFVNGVPVLTNSSTYQYFPSDGDVVMCTLTSSLPCTTGNPATSNGVTMIVNSVPVNRNVNNIEVTGAQCFDAVQTILVAGNETTFSVANGGSATMVAGQNIIFYPGTVVDPGGYLLGYIAPGGPFCNSTKATVVNGTRDDSPGYERKFFRLYPNPTTGEFTLALNGYIPSAKISVIIYDMKGEVVLSSEILNEINHKFSLARKPAGLYLVRVNSGSQSGSCRIVKTD